MDIVWSDLNLKIKKTGFGPKNVPGSWGLNRESDITPMVIGIVIIAVYCFAMGYFIRSQEKTKGWEGY